MTYPSYSSMFHPERKQLPVSSFANTITLQQVEFAVKGMGCASCEPEVEIAVSKLTGIQEVKASALKKNAVVKFDPTKSNIEAIRNAINSTGYTVQNVKP